MNNTIEVAMCAEIVSEKSERKMLKMLTIVINTITVIFSEIVDSFECNEWKYVNTKIMTSVRLISIILDGLRRCRCC